MRARMHKLHAVTAGFAVMISCGGGGAGGQQDSGPTRDGPPGMRDAPVPRDSPPIVDTRVPDGPQAVDAPHPVDASPAIDALAVDAAPPVDAAPAVDAFVCPAPPPPTSDEARFELDRIAAADIAFYGSNGHFVTASNSSVLPGADGGACPDRFPVTTAWTLDPAWPQLGFSIGIPNRFSYHYLGGAGSATALAVGDIDCDGIKITYRLELTSPGGVPTATIIDPPPGTD